ncbi:MAG: SGNH/GDSL hydrolase N-terminal domain-containing protein, partial [Paludibacter sp.]|nr:SGNH/GDSL hydrolase N-terminal domain-containing protein [Paludibacter sp.]
FGQNTVVRMPASAQATVPTAVWGLAQAPAGLQIRFRTNALNIKVAYRGLSSYTSNLWFSQFGANGVDLYARNSDGDWLWVFPVSKSVGSSYSYTNIAPVDSCKYSAEGYEYCLYLPSYASISPLTITVDDGVKNLYYITKDELALDPATDFGDWIHANDKGMYQYGKAYIAKLTEILDFSSGIDTPSQQFNDLTDASYYNIQGVKVEKPLKKTRFTS